jgi:hypothetical protein
MVNQSSLPLAGRQKKRGSLSGGSFSLMYLMCLALFLFGCGNTEPEPAGLSMDELKAQNRAPLEIVSFESIGGDAVLGMVWEANREADSTEAPDVGVVPRNYELTVVNISDRPVTSFQCKITYEDANGKGVTGEEATTEIVWEPAAQLQTLDPGETGQIKILLAAPKNTVAKCAFSAITYQPDPSDVPPLFRSQLSDITWKPFETE